MTKPSDVYVTNSDPMEGPEQITAVAQFAEQGWNFRKGTAAQRGLLPNDEKINGMFWFDTDTGILNRYDGSNWSRFLRQALGTFVGSTSPTGTVTISHGLPTTPAHVFAADWNSGAIPHLRKVLHNTSNSTQTQFVVFDNGGAALASNPVAFSWMAAY
jgi:hypothetical protein